MRKVAVLLLLFLCLMPNVVWAEEPEIQSASAIMIHAGTNRVIYEKNPDIKVYPASTTKIMTALLAIEALEPSTELTVSESAIMIDRDGSNMGLLRDEVLTVEQLLYGLLVHSANDAANVLAEAVSGDIATFVDTMNLRATELGMTGTHFVNTHGYHDEEHYTTARDMMKLAVCAMEQPLFRQVVATATYEIPPTNKYEETRILSNSNALVNRIRDHRYAYDGAAGIKTGYTQDAGSCLVSYAERNGLGYYCVTFSAPVEYEGNYSFLDSIALFNYGFNDFYLKTMSDTNEIVSICQAKWARGDEQVVLSAKEPLEILLPRGYDAQKLTKEIIAEEHVVAPVKEGDILGRLTYCYDGVSLDSVDLVAINGVSRSFTKMILGTIWNTIFSVWVMTPLAIIVLILILRAMNESKKQRMAREKRRQQFRRDFYK
ncbi:MAG: D-alanyl-D-alanine carboxypeptidase [Ruminococcaceae bacterium]|nr:D-alanyl-D-alanine carboxypeptidase [Oscillospiraceae bacterium]